MNFNLFIEVLDENIKKRDMPRGRAGSSRAKPKLPKGTEGDDLTAQEREKKLNVFLAEYDEHGLLLF